MKAPQLQKFHVKRAALYGSHDGQGDSMTLGADNVEILWMGIGLVLIAGTAALLVTTYRRSELGWFLVVLLVPVGGGAAYVAMRVARARETARAT